ncbi:pyocin knob domain-containing protein [Clostridium mobile]|uniref:pyocin knob domain-containing protein n=1 Tax=Clostridium mobile TaxID=2841512 RepID=UPI001FE63233|nr:pyocin knob domain-containing protein [Clostridium mobile]
MYPNDIDKFTEKLNKIDGNTYVIEEEVSLKDGVYEGELGHDNASSSSVRVYAGSKLTGEKLENFILSTPSTTPWKTIIRLYGNVDKAYITYETPGDTIEAEDINKVQESIVNTQKALNSEVERATKSEENINKNLNEEIGRAKNAEKVLTDNLNSEINRAKSAEEKLASNISETNKNLNNEIIRAKASEQNLLDNLNAEVNRAVTSEKLLSDNLNITNDNLNSYKTTNDAEIQGLRTKDTDLENKKANKTYVDTELNKRYLKEQVFTKEEVLQKIKDVIGTAPEALDTLQEIAKALNNDADFAVTMTNELSRKVDKVAGKQLSTEDYTTADKNKLAGVEQGANKYIHPSTHSADIIVENANKRFVSDTEKANWNSKETPTGAQTKADNALKTAKEYTDTHDSNEIKHILAAERTNWNEAYGKRHEHSNKSVLDKITQALLDAWDTSVTHISDSIKHITSNERTLWNTVSNKVDKATGKGLSTNDFDNNYKGKLDGIATGATKVENSSTNGNIKINGTEATVYTHPLGTNPHGTTKGDVELSNVDNVKQATKTEFDTHAADNVKHITAAERTTWNNKWDYNVATIKAVKVNSAVNSDTVGGKNISDFVQRNSLERIEGTTKDLNNYTLGGFYNVKAGVQNYPLNHDGYLIVMPWDISNGKFSGQIVFAGAVNPNPDMYYRYSKSNDASIWSTWTKIAKFSDLPTKLSQLTKDINFDDRYYTEIEANSKFATKQELESAGYGDMLKSIYDKNSNGKIDVAEVADSVTWAGVTGKPSSFNPSTHTHTKAQVTDFPSSLPANGGNADTVDGKHASDFLLKATKLAANTDFNNITAEGIYYNPANAEVVTMKNVPIQQALTLVVLPNAGCTQIVVNYLNNDERIYIRNMYSNNWGSWKQIAKQGDSYLKSESDSKYMKKGSVIWNDLKGV